MVCSGEWQVPDNQIPQTDTRRQQCRSWNLYGTCKFENRCRFEHVESDKSMLSVRNGSCAEDKKLSTQWYGANEGKECWYYHNSTCKFGSRCHNVHTSSKMKAYQTQPVTYAEKPHYKLPENHSDNVQHEQRNNYKSVSNKPQRVTFIRKLNHPRPETNTGRYPHHAQSQTTTSLSHHQTMRPVTSTEYLHNQPQTMTLEPHHHPTQTVTSTGRYSYNAQLQTSNRQPHHQTMRPVTSTEYHHNQSQTMTQEPHHQPAQTVTSTETYLHGQSQKPTQKPTAAWQRPAKINHSSKLKQRRPTQSNALSQSHYTVEMTENHGREQLNYDRWRWEPESSGSRSKRDSNNSTDNPAKNSSCSTIVHCQKVNDEETPQQKPHTETLREDRNDCVTNNRYENYGNDIDERSMPWSSHTRNSPFFSQWLDQQRVENMMPAESVNSENKSCPQVNFNNLIDVSESSNRLNESKQKRRKKTD